MDPWITTAFIGIGATALTDLWSLTRRALWGVPLPDFGLVGRWLAHMPRGRFRHASIAAAPRMAGERTIGWLAHYLIGIAFAALLPVLFGTAWLRGPTLGPAMAVGLGTVAAPFLLMQPGMGAGIAARRSPRPNVARLQSLATHAVFGLGLYASAWATAFIAGH
ncbi:MAG: DUF2938 domain-containing protein [Arenimonas sp.]|uniref:DUF2938 domain-containing protein n=1 Tax=Arenimonas sp. TaxID=1872635 RepID=UPI0025BC8FDB|nr:DUF2938 domain-containing protein [Arenimonas sp.]MBW8368490.1 DUF2938 domain-containing protein [Arenimonas sp.]